MKVVIIGEMRKTEDQRRLKDLPEATVLKCHWSKSHLLTQSPDHFPIHHEIQYGKNSP